MKTKLMIASGIVAISVIMMFSLNDGFSVNAADVNDQGKHYSVNLEETLTLSEEINVSEITERQPKHYTVNLSESLTLSDSTG